MARQPRTAQGERSERQQGLRDDGARDELLPMRMMKDQAHHAEPEAAERGKGAEQSEDAGV